MKLALLGLAAFMVIFAYAAFTVARDHAKLLKYKEQKRKTDNETKRVRRKSK